MNISQRSTRSMPRPGARTVPDVVGCEDCVRELNSKIAAVADRNSTVLICGESGTGKELVARHIHAASSRAAEPCVVVDCTTLRDSLFESQLFGHVKGAFTGAEASTLGLIRAADGGTLFFDEIAELDRNVQARLLRCIQERAVVPVGAVDPIPVDVRIVAATHQDLKSLVRRGEFRADLYYRLDVVRIELPPLRARLECIRPLAEHFLAEQATLYQEPPRRLSPEAVDALNSYAWLGNVRELRNAIEFAIVHGAGDRIGVEDLPPAVRQAAARAERARLSQPRSNGNGVRRPKVRNVVALEVAERCLLKRALRATNGHRSRSAELLGVERHRLLRLIRRHRLEAFAESQRA